MFYIFKRILENVMYINSVFKIFTKQLKWVEHPLFYVDFLIKIIKFALSNVIYAF